MTYANFFIIKTLLVWHIYLIILLIDNISYVDFLFHLERTNGISVSHSYNVNLNDIFSIHIIQDIRIRLTNKFLICVYENFKRKPTISDLLVFDHEVLVCVQLFVDERVRTSANEISIHPSSYRC